MSYVVYFIGGPLDLTKMAKEGNGPSGSVLEIAEAVRPLRIHNYTAGESIAFERMPTHRYEVLPLPYTGSAYNYHDHIFVAVYMGRE